MLEKIKTVGQWIGIAWLGVQAARHGQEFYEAWRDQRRRDIKKLWRMGKRK